MIDGSDFLKQLLESVGGKRQCCGEVGKRANCQAGVFWGYASELGYTVLIGVCIFPKNGLKMTTVLSAADYVVCPRISPYR